MLNYHVHQTTFSVPGSDHTQYTRKCQLAEAKRKCYKNQKGLCRRKNFALGKNGSDMPSGVGSRLIVVEKQAGKQNSYNLQNFYNSTASILKHF